MKTINRIHYFLFAIILVGMFASFAQNDYSSILLSYPFLFIGILFFVEMLFSFKEFGKNRSSALFSFFERLALGLFFCGTFFMTMHWAATALALLTGGLIILILYLSFGFKTLFQNFGSAKGKSLIIFGFTFVTCLAMIACIFNIRHWAFSGPLTVTSGIFSFLFLMLIVFNIQMQQGKDKIYLRDYLRQINTKLVFSYTFFSFWTIYLTLVSFGMAPRLYSLANPPALDKLYQEQSPVADVYRKNYEQFLDNRKAANSNMKDNLNSDNINDSLEISSKK